MTATSGFRQATPIFAGPRAAFTFRPSLLLGAGIAFAAIAAIAAGTATCGAEGPARQYVEAQLKVVRSLEAKSAAIADIADEAAARLLAGGKIYLAGESGIVTELAGRAGGLCGAKALSLDKAPVSLAPGDLVLLSDYGRPAHWPLPGKSSRPQRPW